MCSSFWLLAGRDREHSTWMPSGGMNQKA